MSCSIKRSLEDEASISVVSPDPAVALSFVKDLILLCGANHIRSPFSSWNKTNISNSSFC